MPRDRDRAVSATAARFPGVRESAGHYESFFLKAARPGGGQAVWIRYTVHKAPNAAPRATLWLTVFDRAAAQPWAIQQTVDASHLVVPQDAYLRIGPSVIGPGIARGTVVDDSREARFELGYTDTGVEPLWHLASRLLYRAPLPRTKLLSPYPDTSFSGTVRYGDTTLSLHGWPGMIGHNWGAEHAERWVWLHTNLPHRSGWLDLAAGRIKLGPVTTPWITNGSLSLDGRRYRVGGLDRITSTQIEARPGRCEFTVTGRDITVTGRVNAPHPATVNWLYGDPGGGVHHVLNCSIADLDLDITRPGHTPTHLTQTGATAYELGMREDDHQIPVQAYPPN